MLLQDPPVVPQPAVNAPATPMAFTNVRMFDADALRFLADQMKLPRYAIVLQSGQRSRDKLVRIDGLSEEEIRRRCRAVSLGGGARRGSTQSHASGR